MKRNILGLFLRCIPSQFLFDIFVKLNAVENSKKGLK